MTDWGSILRFSPAKVASNPLFIRFCSFKMNCRSTVIDFSGIEAPVLVIYGGKDPYLNYELLGRISGELPAGSEMQMIDGASHVAYIEKPYYRKFQRMLIEFLRK